MKGFWSREASTYSALSNESHVQYLHPLLRRLMTELGSSRVLDFGSGDGRLLDSDEVSYKEAWLYDPSSSALRLAKKRFAGRSDISFCASVNRLQSSFFDTVVCCLVLMTISSTDELKLAVSAMRDCIADSGNCLVAITHPCFRQYAFSTFFTSYTMAEPFKYLEEGSSFTVFLRDPKKGESLSLVDYHWSLSYVLNLFSENLFVLERMIEVADHSLDNSSHNHLYPSYMVLKYRPTQRRVFTQPD